MLKIDKYSILEPTSTISIEEYDCKIDDNLQNLLVSVETIKETFTKIIQWIRDKITALMQFFKNKTKKNSDENIIYYNKLKSKFNDPRYNKECHVKFTIHMPKCNHYLLYITQNVKVDNDEFNYNLNYFIDTYITSHNAILGGRPKNIIDKYEQLKEEGKTVTITIDETFNNHHDFFYLVNELLNKYEQFLKVYKRDLEFKEKNIEELEKKIAAAEGFSRYHTEYLESFKLGLRGVNIWEKESTAIYDVIWNHFKQINDHVLKS